jgi:adenylate kinase
MKTAPLMQYYNDQGKFYAVNGIEVYKITTRLSTVINL